MVYAMLVSTEQNDANSWFSIIVVIPPNIPESYGRLTIATTTILGARHCLS